mmetsp:Transcript_70403/g.168638  ORF Transcript_70403/g.168638 Transcript_70403/m.168638 type:complete len:126 (+) Transcript_70403:49-426(+)
MKKRQQSLRKKAGSALSNANAKKFTARKGSSFLMDLNAQEAWWLVRGVACTLSGMMFLLAQLFCMMRNPILYALWNKVRLVSFICGVATTAFMLYPGMLEDGYFFVIEWRRWRHERGRERSGHMV